MANNSFIVIEYAAIWTNINSGTLNASYNNWCSSNDTVIVAPGILSNPIPGCRFIKSPGTVTVITQPKISEILPF